MYIESRFRDTVCDPLAEVNRFTVRTVRVWGGKLDNPPSAIDYIGGVKGSYIRLRRVSIPNTNTRVGIYIYNRNTANDDYDDDNDCYEVKTIHDKYKNVTRALTQLSHTRTRIRLKPPWSSLTRKIIRLKVIKVPILFVRPRSADVFQRARKHIFVVHNLHSKRCFSRFPRVYYYLLMCECVSPFFHGRRRRQQVRGDVFLFAFSCKREKKSANKNINIYYGKHNRVLYAHFPTLISWYFSIPSRSSRIQIPSWAV